MTNDYTQMVSPIWPKTSNERFKPLLALVAAQIPHLIWGYDALVHSNFDYDVACKELQIIIKSKDLEAAVNAIKESDSFYISSPKSMLLAEVPHNRYYFESDCRFLWAPKNSGTRWIVLIPEERRYVSAADGALSDSLAESPYFLIDDRQKYKDVKVAEFFILLNSMLKQMRLWDTNEGSDKEDKDLRITGSLTLLTDTLGLVAWKSGLGIQGYKRMEDIPPIFLEIYEGIDDENDAEYQKWFLRKEIEKVFLSHGEVKDTNGSTKGAKEDGTTEASKRSSDGDLKLGDDKGSAMICKDSEQNGDAHSGPTMGDDYKQLQGGIALQPQTDENSEHVSTTHPEPTDNQSQRSSLSGSRLFYFGLSPPRKSRTMRTDADKNAGASKKEGPLKKIKSWAVKKISLAHCFGERDQA